MNNLIRKYTYQVVYQLTKLAVKHKLNTKIITGLYFRRIPLYRETTTILTRQGILHFLYGLVFQMVAAD